MKFELNEYHRGVSPEELLADLKRVAEALGKDSVTTDEYDCHGRYYSSTLRRRFDSWFSALDKAGLKRTRTLGVTDEEYFANLEKVWRMLGRQPKYGEIRKPISEYSVGAYEYRFGSWRKALQAFVDYMNSEDSPGEPTIEPGRITESITPPNTLALHKTSRTIDVRKRFLVMRRDNFTCRLCGASPARDNRVELVVDHLIPWSRGGETVMDNLQTLCKPCNQGKSDLPLTIGND